MIDRRAEVGMGDALCAIHELGLSQSQIATLVELLGMVEILPTHGLRKTRPTARPIPADRANERQTAHLDGRSSLSTGDSARPDQDAVGNSEPLTASDFRSTIRSRERTIVTEIAPLAPIIFGERIKPLARPDSGVPIVKYEPILPDYLLRASLTMLLRRPRPSNRPDLAALVEAVVTGRPVRGVKNETELALDRGATILADVGPGMLPFIEDVEHLVGQVLQVVGAPGVVVIWSDDAADKINFRTDRPILIVSALGEFRSPTTEPGSAQRWRELLTDLESEDHDVVALVPQRSLADRLRSAGGRGATKVVAWDALAAAGRGRA